MLALAAVVVMVGSHLVAAAGPHSTARAPARGASSRARCDCAPTRRDAIAQCDCDTARGAPAHGAPARGAPARGTPTSRAAPARGAPSRGVITNGGTRHYPDPEGQRNAQLGCALCLAVADWLNTSLAEAHKQKPDEQFNKSQLNTSLLNTSLLEAHEQKQRLTPAEVSAVLANACKSGFVGYRLWPPAMTQLIEFKLAEARDQVEQWTPTPAPGSWMERLRKECLWYVQEAGEEELYRQWRGMLGLDPQRLDLFLCKSSGWLRVCVNLSDEELPELLPARAPASAIATKATKTSRWSVTRFRIICSRLLCWPFYLF